MKWKYLITRSIYYFRTGYGLYLTFPLAFISFVSTVYYLAVKNIPVLENLFPHFLLFILFTLLFIPPISVLVGWMHFKRLLSPFYRAQLDIDTEANPYAQRIVGPVNVPYLKVISELGKLHGVDTSALDKIIRETEIKFKLVKE